MIDIISNILIILHHFTLCSVDSKTITKNNYNKNRQRKKEILDDQFHVCNKLKIIQIKKIIFTRCLHFCFHERMSQICVNVIHRIICLLGIVVSMLQRFYSHKKKIIKNIIFLNFHFVLFA